MNHKPLSLSLTMVLGILVAITGCLRSASAEEPFCKQKKIFARGVDGYHTYRIPALVVTPKGTVLAFCEGRKNNARDHGDIDLLLKRSLDGGRTWSPQQIVHEEGGRKKITIGNPCPVVDHETGKVWLTFCRNNKDIFVTHSDDEGKTWSKPRNITKDVKRPGWTWYATGPGNGIQLQRGPRRGRLVIPCDHNVMSGYGKKDSIKLAYSHVFYSDDHGQSWQLGGVCGPTTNECAVVELDDGTLMLNMRNAGDARHRAVATSTDSGETWSEVRRDRALPEPRCEASFIRLPDGKDQLLFSNPASTTDRIAMTVRLSEDGGRTWPIARRLHKGPSAYSCLAVAKDGTILCLYEGGKKHRYQALRLARFNLAWLKQPPEATRSDDVSREKRKKARRKGEEH